MNHNFAAAAVAAALTIALAGCTKAIEPAAPASNASTTPIASSSTPAPTPTTEEAVPTEEVTPTPEESSPDPSAVQEGHFGERASFTQEDNTFDVTVGTPYKAKCQYASIGCSKPETGDRVITVRVVIKNSSKGTIEVSPSMFSLEFADGTRMDASDGAASDFTPDNAMDYSRKMRPGSTYTSTLTFEAPKGKYSIVMGDSQFGGGADLFIWSGK